MLWFDTVTKQCCGLIQQHRSAVFRLSDHCFSPDCRTDPENHDLLLGVLWDGVVHSAAVVRATAASLFEVITSSHILLVSSSLEQSFGYMDVCVCGGEG